jgi:hypothetical protein
MKRLIPFFLLLTLALTLLAACTAKLPDSGEKLPDGAVKVYSNYPNLSYLIPGDFDYSKFEDGTWARYGYNTYVTEVDGILAVMPAHIHDSSRVSHVVREESFLLRGESYSVGQIEGTYKGVFLNNSLVIEEACVGIFPSYMNNRALVFTVADGSTNVRLFEREDDQSSWTMTDCALSFDGEMKLYYCNWLSQFYDAPKELYIITDQNLTILRSDGDLTAYSDGALSMTVETIEVPEWWSYLKPTSVTRTDDGTVFVGDRIDGGVEGHITGKDRVAFKCTFIRSRLTVKSFTGELGCQM